MSDHLDDQGMDFNEGEVAQAAPAKKKNPPILKILAFVGIGILAVGLIATVVIITVGAISGQGQAAQMIKQSMELTSVPPIYETSSVLAEVRTMTKDPESERANVSVTFKLAFDVEDKAIPEEISKRKDQLNEKILFYFMDRSAAQLEDRERVKAELLELVNQNLSRSAIREVIITSYNIVKP
jgi:flagellar basal body-associated protein FliL